jgi:hypothetical protein
LDINTIRSVIVHKAEIGKQGGVRAIQMTLSVRFFRITSLFLASDELIIIPAYRLYSVFLLKELGKFIQLNYDIDGAKV